MTRLLTYDQVCEYLGISRSTFNRNFVRPGKVTKIMVGPKSPRFDEAELAVAVYLLGRRQSFTETEVKQETHEHGY